jgi:group I intron endonuclease
MKKENKIIGVYKIISPSGKVYIGQSRDIKKRLSKYKRLDCKEQPKLYRSFIKYGIETHIFETIEECLFENLNLRERHWQDFYEVVNPEKGLNCTLTKTDELPHSFSLETLEKLREASTGKKYALGSKHSEKTKEKYSLDRKGNKYSLGYKQSEETKMKKLLRSCKIILNLETGIYYFGIREASNTLNIKYSTLTAKLNGRCKNNTYFIYV